jgi:hypothetical protein
VYGDTVAVFTMHTVFTIVRLVSKTTDIVEFVQNDINNLNLFR